MAFAARRHTFHYAELAAVWRVPQDGTQEPVGFETAAGCFVTLLRWWGCNWNVVRLAIDPVAIAFPNIVRTAEQLKQRWISPAPGAGQARKESKHDNDYR